MQNTTHQAIVARIQAYLRHSATTQYETVAIPPFTVFLHPTDDLTFFNYAIPDEPAGGDLGVALEHLRTTFRMRGRRPRFEFLEDFAPDLAPALRAAGFAEEARLHLMVCTPDTLVAPPTVPGLTVTELGPHTSLTDARDFMQTQRQGFNPLYAEIVSDEEAAQWARGMHGGGSFLARLDGAAASVGGFSAPHDGLTEVVGIATRDEYRRRGIASALTYAATRAAFERGVEVACLTAGDERARRVYERIGFRPFATTLFYIDAAE